MRPTPCWRPTPPPWLGRGSLCGPCAGAAAAVWYWCTGLLERDGYPLAGGLEAMLDHLASRMAGSGGFPHEVGLFLGYPAEDVEGFRRHGGQGYKYSGLWKVYSDVERAQRCFRQYGCCRRALCRRLEAGCRLVQLFRTA